MRIGTFLTMFLLKVCDMINLFDRESDPTGRPDIVEVFRLYYFRVVGDFKSDCSLRFSSGRKRRREIIIANISPVTGDPVGVTVEGR